MKILSPALSTLPGIRHVEGRIRKIITAKDCIRRVILDDKRTLEADIVFSLYGSVPRTELLRALPVRRRNSCAGSNSQVTWIRCSAQASRISGS